MKKNRLGARLVMLAGFAALSLASAAAQAQQTPMRYIYNAPESTADTRYTYHWKILQTALEKTREEYGPFVLEPGPEMSERRQAYEMTHNTGRLTVMYLGPTPELEAQLTPVRIPVDRNLAGYNVFLIRKSDRARFANVRTLDDLRRFRFGLGLGWVDVDILRSSGLNVETGSSYEGLFEMLVNGRFDVFLRGAVEVLDELKQRPQLMQDLEIEPRLGIYYPLPMYFWFSRSPDGQQLAKRAEAGMRRMIADGTYDRLFSEYQDWKIRTLDLAHRHFIEIPNPYARMKKQDWDRRLWFSPHTYRPRTAEDATP